MCASPSHTGTVTLTGAVQRLRPALDPKALTVSSKQTRHTMNGRVFCHSCTQGRRRTVSGTQRPRQGHSKRMSLLSLWSRARQRHSPTTQVLLGSELQLRLSDKLSDTGREQSLLLGLLLHSGACWSQGASSHSMTTNRLVPSEMVFGMQQQQQLQEI